MAPTNRIPLQHLTPEEAARLVELAENCGGTKPAARMLGCHPVTFAKAAGMLPLRPGSVALLKLRLAELALETPAAGSR